MQHATFHRSALALALSAALLLPTAAFAQAAGGQAAGSVATQSTPDSSKPAKTLKEVVVLGSRIPRTELEGAKPVVTITGVQIKKEGFTTLWEFMNSLPQVGRAQTPPSWGSTSVNARQLNLRNMGPQFTQLMIDGYRVVDYPQSNNGRTNFQNYNNIPTGMIDRVEILASGASSIYGADAVAGVVNVILKKEYQGDDLQLTAGGATRGARQYGNFSWTGGRSGDHWHVIYNLEHTNRSPLWAKDRPYTDSEADAGYGTWNPSARMFGYQTYDAMSLYDINGNYITPPPGSCESFQNFSRRDKKTIATSGDQVTGPVTDYGQYCTQHDLFRNWVLTPGLQSNDAAISGEYDLNDNLQAYGSVALWDTHGVSQTQRPFAYPMGGLPVPFYDSGTGQVVTSFLRQLTYAEMGTQANTYDNEQYWNIHAGLRGAIFNGRFNWDLNLGYQKYIVHENYTGLNEQGMFDFFFGPQLGTTTINGTTYPVYHVNQQRYWYPITPTQYSTFGVAGENNAWSWMQNATLNVNGNLFNVPWDDKPIGWAAVLEAYHNGYQLAPDPRGNTLDFGDPFQDYNTGGGSRNRYSFATEFRIPVLSTLDIDLSGRADKYVDASIADIAKTWGLSIEWRPVKSLLLRGSYGTNFKAPDMQAIYQTQSASTVGIYRDDLQCIQADDFNCQATQHSTYFTHYQGGSPNLLPESGHGWTYGLVWDIPWVDGLSFSADYWHTGVNNAINYIDADTLLADEAGCITGLTITGAPYTTHAPGSAYCQLAIKDVIRGADGNITAIHTGPINESSLYVSGIDASLDYHWTTNDWGNFNLSINYTDNLSYRERVLPSDPLLNTRYQNVASKVTGIINWNRGAWDASISGLRYGSLRDNNFGGCEVLSNGIMPSQGDAACTPYYGMIKPWITWSGSVGYQFDKRIKMTLIVHNIFDRVGRIPYYAGGFEFIPTQQGDTYDGREVFLQINYKLD